MLELQVSSTRKGDVCPEMLTIWGLDKQLRFLAPQAFTTRCSVSLAQAWMANLM